jgi:hypothetical protein
VQAWMLRALAELAALEEEAAATATAGAPGDGRSGDGEPR